MNRRKYLAAVGSIAASGAFAMGTGASIDIWANRDTNVDVVRDTDGLIGLAPGTENGQFADTSGGTLSVDLSTDDDGAGVGVNVGARTTIDDIFRIRNQSGDNQVVWIKDSKTEDLLGDDGPVNFFRGPVELEDGAEKKKFRLVSAIDPVPGTPGDVQRLSITGLVPPQNIIEKAGGEARDQAPKGWIKPGAPVKNTETGDVGLDGDLQVGDSKGRLFLTPGESMTVGIDADFRGYELTTDGDLKNRDDDNLGSAEELLPNQIQIVSRGLDDAKDLATSNTEFNTAETDE